MTRYLPIPPPESWQHDPERLRQFLTAANLSGSQAAALIGVDGRTIRRWTGGEREMPYSAWYTLLSRSNE